VVSECGDGKATGDEQCDDGNQDDEDGCTNTCKIKCSDVDDGAKLNPANGHCYWEENGWFNDSWGGRRGQCQDKGGHLVTLSSTEENTFVQGLHKGEVWIGATDNKKADQQGPGAYVWVNGEPFVYKNWAPGEPNAAAGGCGVFDTCYEHCAVQREDGLWNDRQCGDENEAICEWEPPGF
jgi:cysteine-rich repeat protein